MHSKDIAVGYALGFNDGLGKGGGTVYNGLLRAVLDDESGAINIVVSDTADEAYADYLYSYEFVIYSEEIVVVSTVGETTTTTTTTQNFSKRIVTKVIDSSGAILLITNYDDETGEIISYADSKDKQIHTAEWRTEWTVAEAQSNGANSAVIAWVMAHNAEQSSSVAIQKKMYRKGIKQGADSGGDVTEKITEPLDDEGFNVLDENGPIIDMTKGVYILTDETTINNVTGVFQLHIYLDGYSETVGQDTNANRIVVELTGNGINQSYTFEGQYWEGTTGGVNDYYMTQATINKGYPGITGIYYWEYGESYYNRNWQFSGNYAIALQAGSTISTVSFI